jgi:hypothetical protein
VRQYLHGKTYGNIWNSSLTATLSDGLYANVIVCNNFQPEGPQNLVSIYSCLRFFLDLEINDFLFAPPIGLGIARFFEFCGERAMAADETGDDDEGMAGAIGEAIGAEAIGKAIGEAIGADDIGEGTIDCPTGFTRFIKAVADT